MADFERRILAAQGYVELGLHAEARAELASLPTSLTQRADVMELNLLCLMGEQRWADALKLSQRLCTLEPDMPGGFIHAAYCLHELGCTEEALDVLARGPAGLRTKPVYYYNLGCYLACLGQKEKALNLLRRAFEMDASLRSHARKDADLDGLRPQLEKL
jgi:tetratricopeptide (TPR) repeat protein